MKIGFISYTNTVPFYYQWPSTPFEILTGTPKQLAEAAQKGEIIAAPLPITECWKLEDQFEPLGNYGIGAKKEVHSVFLLSRQPLSHLNNKTIGVTHDSSASVRLLQVLTGQRYNHTNRLKRGFADDDDAWLVIGDQALKFWNSPSPQWGCVTDLAAEWWAWKKMPFVFARWMVKKDLDTALRDQLVQQLKGCLEKGLSSLEIISQEQSQKLGIEASKIKFYLQGFRYLFGEEEEKAIEEFRFLARKFQEIEEVKVP